MTTASSSSRPAAVGTETMETKRANHHHGQRRCSTFTAHAAYFDENYADPVESVAGDFGTVTHAPPTPGPGPPPEQCSPLPGRKVVFGGPAPGYSQPLYDDPLAARPASHSSSSLSLEQASYDSLAARSTDSKRIADYWEDDPPPNNAKEDKDQHDRTQPFDKWDHHQRTDFYNDDCYCSPGINASGTTEGLSDDQESEDEDEDICEEQYRQLPPRRLPPCSQDSAVVVEEQIVLHGRNIDSAVVAEKQQIVLHGRNLEPEECTGEETTNKVVVHNRQKHVRHSSQKIVHHVPPVKNSNQLTLFDASTKYNGYQHCFITVKEQHRFLVLYTFLKRNTSEKIIIFFSTTKSTQYYGRLLKSLKLDVQVIHNGQSSEKFLETFFQFSKKRDGGILCIPDCQGMDVTIPPSVSWMVQFEPTADPAEYIFRVGRISSENNCRSSTKVRQQSRALLFLTPDQYGFLKYYKAAKVKFYEYEIPKIANVQKELMRLVRKDDKLRKIGVEAYHAYLMAYARHEFRDIYNVHDLDQRNVALRFGFEKPPSKKEDDKDCVDDGSGQDKSSRSGQDKSSRSGQDKSSRSGQDKSSRSGQDKSSRSSREENRWKPEKCEKAGWKQTKPAENTCWMTGKKSWRYANVHADKMKVRESDGKTNPDDYKPKTIKFR